MPCKKKGPSRYEAGNPLLAMTGQYNLFESQGFKVGPTHGKVTGGLGEGQQGPKKKQGALFGKSGLPGQMNLFPDKAVPDDLVAKPKKPKKPKAQQGLFGLGERGEKIGSELGGAVGGAGGALAAARLKLPKKTAIATGTALGRRAGGKLGRKVGSRLQGGTPTKMSLARSEAIRVADSVGFDEHETNLLTALLEAQAESGS